MAFSPLSIPRRGEEKKNWSNISFLHSLLRSVFPRREGKKKKKGSRAWSGSAGKKEGGRGGASNTPSFRFASCWRAGEGRGGERETLPRFREKGEGKKKKKEDCLVAYRMNGEMPCDTEGREKKGGGNRRGVKFLRRLQSETKRGKEKKE